ncbi:MAG: hypothetical protein ACRYG8_26925 [Janthinobacterium lividum]
MITMAYQSTNHRAATNPLRSIPMFRPVAVLGQSFASTQVPADQARVLAAQKLEQARDEIGAAWEFYTDAKAAVGAVNRMSRKDRHDRDIYSDRQVARRRSAAFGTMNRMRGRFLRAHKALLAAEAAFLALAH